MARNGTFSLNIGWQALLSDLSVHGGHVLRKAGLPDDTLSRDNHALTTAEYFRFWGALEDEVRDPLFALRIVDTVSAESFDPPLFCGSLQCQPPAGCPTVGEIQTVGRPHEPGR